MATKRSRDRSFDPLQLPPVTPRELPTLTGDRRAVVRFCAGCGSALEASVVIRGYWAYCSYECAIRTERADEPPE